MRKTIKEILFPNKAEKILNWENVNIDVPNKDKRSKNTHEKVISNAYGSVGNGLYCIYGPKGSGKTTLLNALYGIIPEGSITSGKISYDGKERDGKNWLLGNMIHGPHFYDSIATVGEEIVLSLRLPKRPKDIEQITFDTQHLEETINLFNLTEILSNRWNSLSISDKFKLQTIKNIIKGDQIFFLDTAKCVFNEKERSELLLHLKMMADNGKTVFVTQESLDDSILPLFDKIIVLSSGETLFCGKIDDLEEICAGIGLIKNQNETFLNYLENLIVFDRLEEEQKIKQLIEFNEVQNGTTIIDENKIQGTKNHNYYDSAPSLLEIGEVLNLQFSLSDPSRKRMVKNIIWLVLLIFCAIFPRIYSDEIIDSIYALSEEQKELNNLNLKFFFAGSLFYPLSLNLLNIIDGWSQNEQFRSTIRYMMESGRFTAGTFLIISLFYFMFRLLGYFAIMGTVLPIFWEKIDFIIPLKPTSMFPFYFANCFFTSFFYRTAGSISKSRLVAIILVLVAAVLNIVPFIISLVYSQKYNMETPRMLVNVLGILPGYHFSRLIFERQREIYFGTNEKVTERYESSVLDDHIEDKIKPISQLENGGSSLSSMDILLCFFSFTYCVLPFLLFLKRSKPQTRLELEEKENKS